jgi:hypothetical protein
LREGSGSWEAEEEEFGQRHYLDRSFNCSLQWGLKKERKATYLYIFPGRGEGSFRVRIDKSYPLRNGAWLRVFHFIRWFLVPTFLPHNVGKDVRSISADCCSSFGMGQHKFLLTTNIWLQSCCERQAQARGCWCGARRPFSDRQVRRALHC